MHRRLPTAIPLLLGLLLVAGLGLGTWAWLQHDPLADGYQNEYLHVGNAFDLFSALMARDGWHLRYYTTHNYWPPFFYIAPWPWLAALGMSRFALVLSNLSWLSLALLCTYHLGRDRIAGAVAILVLALSPGVFGSLTRYEPNLANVACLALALYTLHRSRQFTDRRWSWLLGAALALGLMTDRLGTAPFMALPILLALVVRWRRQGLGDTWRRLLALAIPVIILAGPWYVNWFSNEFAEVSSQLSQGEIDATGSLMGGIAPTRLRAWLYYPLSLLDSQAGPVLGLAMLLSLAARPRRLLWATVLGGWVLFALIEKKQVFYTLPLLVPLAVSCGDAASRLGPLRLPLALLLLAAGLHQYAGRLWDRPAPLLAPLARPQPLPDAWVEPRHPLARAPVDIHLPLDDWAQELAGADLIFFSEDPVLFEGFLMICFRERLPHQRVRALLQDPQGSYEWFRATSRFLVIRPPPATWPTRQEIEASLLTQHYDLTRLPPLADVIEEQRPAWDATRRWTLPTGSTATLWSRAR